MASSWQEVLQVEVVLHPELPARQPDKPARCTAVKPVIAGLISIAARRGA